MRHEQRPMQPSWTEVALGTAVVVATLLFAVSGSPAGQPPASAAAVKQDTEFNRSVAGVYATLQTLRHLHKEMQRHAADPAKGKALQDKFQQSQARLGELVTTARDAARSDEQRQRAQQLALVVNSVVQTIGEKR